MYTTISRFLDFVKRLPKETGTRRAKVYEVTVLQKLAQGGLTGGRVVVYIRTHTHMYTYIRICTHTYIGIRVQSR